MCKADGFAKVHREGINGAGSSKVRWSGEVKLPSVNLYKQTLSKNVQVPVRKSAGSGGCFGRIFPDVWAMTGLKPGAKVVFGGLAIWGKGEEVVGLSHGYLAGVCGMRRSTVSAGLDALEAAGLIEKYGAPSDQVQPYKIIYPLMLKGVRLQSDVVIREKERKVLIKCLKPSCGKLTRPHKTGWCFKCRKEVEHDAHIRRIAEKVVAQSVAERLAG